MHLSRYKKSVVSFIGGVATWALTALADNHVSNAEWAGLVLGVLTALGVYQVRNSGTVDDTQPADAGVIGWAFVLVIAVIILALIGLASLL